VLNIPSALKVKAGRGEGVYKVSLMVSTSVHSTVTSKLVVLSFSAK